MKEKNYWARRKNREKRKEMSKRQEFHDKN